MSLYLTNFMVKLVPRDFVLSSLVIRSIGSAGMFVVLTANIPFLMMLFSTKTYLALGIPHSLQSHVPVESAVVPPSPSHVSCTHPHVRTAAGWEYDEVLHLKALRKLEMAKHRLPSTVRAPGGANGVICLPRMGTLCYLTLVCQICHLLHSPLPTSPPLSILSLPTSPLISFLWISWNLMFSGTTFALLLFLFSLLNPCHLIFRNPLSLILRHSLTQMLLFGGWQWIVKQGLLDMGAFEETLG